MDNIYSLTTKMPFKKTDWQYKSGSGKKYTEKQVKLYYATEWFKPWKMRKLKNKLKNK